MDGRYPIKLTSSCSFPQFKMSIQRDVLSIFALTSQLLSRTQDPWPRTQAPDRKSPTNISAHWSHHDSSSYQSIPFHPISSPRTRPLTTFPSLAPLKSPPKCTSRTRKSYASPPLKQYTIPIISLSLYLLPLTLNLTAIFNPPPSYPSAQQGRISPPLRYPAKPYRAI